jgi:mannosyl-3-phosphoglycerate phosphatase family protein
MNTPTMHTQYIVVTDLDGTLLDHDNYSFDAAKPALAQLAQQHIPVIINSSKTAAEIKVLRHALKNTHPFISENGSAISIPEHYDYSLSNKNTNNIQASNLSSESIILGTPRSDILKTIENICLDFPFQFTQYHRCNINDIVRLTGLSADEAKLSSQRDYSEPLQWLGSDAEKADFITRIEQRGLHILQGGRFMHVMGLTDKGQANERLYDLYSEHNSTPIKSIALGDSHNDIAMLQAADIAVVVRSPHNALPEFHHPNKIISQHYGPDGWNESIQQIIFNE